MGRSGCSWAKTCCQPVVRRMPALPSTESEQPVPFVHGQFLTALSRLGREVPIEFDKVTDTVPALVLPLYGTARTAKSCRPRRATAAGEPGCRDGAEAHGLRGSVSVSPEAGVNVKVALVRSRVVEYAMSVTLNPLVVIFVICTSRRDHRR